MDFSNCTAAQIASYPIEDYVRKATESMQARFSRFVVTPEQTEAWKIGFGWIHDLAHTCLDVNPLIRFHPEFSAPLLSGRPDLVVDTGSHLFVVEMKTGIKVGATTGEKQVWTYADDIWGKVKIGRHRYVVPVLLTNDMKNESDHVIPTTDFQKTLQTKKVNIKGLKMLVLSVGAQFAETKNFDGNNESLIKYSPRPSVVEAATALVAALDDKNIITGLANTEELERLIEHINHMVLEAFEKKLHVIVVVTGSPGSGKTLVGLRIAHDPAIQKILSAEIGTPLYLTGNAPLVEVLVESLARDQVRRLGTNKSISHSQAATKVRLIHGITERNIGIESNVIVFDEGQRIWTEEHMRRKKGDLKVGSEADEILKYLELLPWAIAVVLLGEGQEINTGEAGLVTWLRAVENRNEIKLRKWSLVAPTFPIEYLDKSMVFKVEPKFHLMANQRTDNSANISAWVEEFLLGNFSAANSIAETFKDFPFYFTRDLAVARKWLRDQAEAGGTSFGLVASSKSKRLINYGLDPAADANRSFNWANWYLNRLPDLNSAEALEVAATEYKCQGLELDWVGVCWSWDLVTHDGTWAARTLDSAKGKWKATRSRSEFQINAYRVLLTRSRKGLVVWVPTGVPSDPSRKPSEMDDVAEALRLSGMKELP